MCAPMALALGSLVIGAAQGMAQYQQGQQAAERQNQYYQMNQEATNKALVNTYAGQQNQQIQERNASSQQAMQGEVKALQARSTAVTAAGEAGVSGLSVNELLGDYYSRESANRDAIDSNYQMTRDGIRANMEASQAGAISRINSVQQAVAPSFGDALLRIGGSALSAGGQYFSMTNAMKNGTSTNQGFIS